MVIVNVLAFNLFYILERGNIEYSFDFFAYIINFTRTYFLKEVFVIFQTSREIDTIIRNVRRDF